MMAAIYDAWKRRLLRRNTQNKNFRTFAANFSLGKGEG